MNKYFPFLKLKSNEISALSLLSESQKNLTFPVLDFPRNEYTDIGFEQVVEKSRKKLTKYWGSSLPFFLDNYDVDSSLLVDGSDSYAYLLEAFSELEPAIVVGLDRTTTHNRVAFRAIEQGHASSKYGAFRITLEDISLFRAQTPEIEVILEELGTFVEQVVVLLDLRVLAPAQCTEAGLVVGAFVDFFGQKMLNAEFVLTGSTIPAVLSALLHTHESGEFVRNELSTRSVALAATKFPNRLRVGDYGTISPEYSDTNLPKEILQTVMTPKLIYSFGDSVSIQRGGALKTHPKGSGQYKEFAEILVGKHYFRGEAFSDGDRRLVEISRGQGSKVTPGSIITPTLNAHLAFMLARLSSS